MGTTIWHAVRVLLVLAIAACAAAPPAPPPVDAGALTAAGFKVLTATTTVQQQHLRDLPQGRITEMQRTGAKFFVYPDAAANRLYVGTPKEFAAYQARVPGTPNPQAQINAQATAGEAAYLKRDATMALANQQVASDPWYFWPSFVELGW
jgi:hypothetical protein